MALFHSTIVSSPHSIFFIHTSPLIRSSPRLFQSSHFASKRFESYLVSSLASSAASFPYNPIDVEYLRREFSGHGATFEDIGETCIAKLSLDNGASASVMLTRGVITSYKVPVWHGGKVEILHTWVEEDDNGEVVIQGGASSMLNLDSNENKWDLYGISGDSEDSVQVELRRNDKIRELELKQIISLRKDTLSLELYVSNKSNSAIRLENCSLLSYLTVSTPEATYAVGLQGSDFVETAQRNEEDKKEKSGFGGEEESNYKQLNEEMSRIYTCAPQSFTVIDRGRRNSVVVGREGFEEVYVYSPGSRFESYTKSAYVCIGPSSKLNPISLDPDGVWSGVLHLHNPNS